MPVLKRHSDFLRIKDEGSRFSPCSWFFVGFLKNEKSTGRFGWTISRKVGSAVVRNKLKRWCRTIVREYKGVNKSFDINIVFRAKNEEFYKKVSFNEFKQALSRGLDHIFTN